MIILAIDPGPAESAYVLIDSADCRPRRHGKAINDELVRVISTTAYDQLAVEMIASYGMAVGAEVFQTCVWIGRFVQRHEDLDPTTPWVLVKRKDIATHHCHSARANDANVAQALIDRFAPGVRNRGKGTKTEPGWFHGFRSDIWAAYALAVYVADQLGEAAA